MSLHGLDSLMVWGRWGLGLDSLMKFEGVTHMDSPMEGLDTYIYIYTYAHTRPPPAMIHRIGLV